MSLKKASITVVKDCIGLKEREKVLIIVDEMSSKKISESLFEACKGLKAEPAIMQIVERKTHGEELPAFVAATMKIVDVVLAPTTKSLSHTEARREASKVGVRIASMPGITEEMLERALSANYIKISELTKVLARILSNGREAKIISPNGTNVKLSIKGRDAHADTGILREKGNFGNLPAGEAYIAPIENTAGGKIVIDGAMAGIDELDEPIVTTITEGKITNIEGGKAAVEFKKMVKDANNENARNVAELGIGTNEKALLHNNLLEMEKVLGTVHIAFGDNKSMGGVVESSIHVDGVILKPTLIVDGEKIMEDGMILV